MLVDRDDPNIQDDQTLVGVWVAGKFDTKTERDKVLWSVLMEYMRNPLVKNRTSINLPKTGILILFESSNRKNLYLFEVPEHAKWSFNLNYESVAQIPSEYVCAMQ